MSSLPERTLETTVSPSPSPLPGSRIRGLDVARALAIIGMVMIHFGPSSPPPVDWPALFYGISHGRASLLFVVLAGIGMTLLAGSPGRLKWRRAWPRVLVRVLVLLPLGFALQTMDIRVFVILHFYAIFFVLAVPATLVRDWVVLGAAIFLSLSGPVAYFLIDEFRPGWLLRWEDVTLGDPPGLIARELLVTGSYPAMVWMAPFLLGMWLGRRRLTASVTRLGMLVGGAGAYGFSTLLGAYLPEGGWWELGSTEPHSQAILWLVGSTGTAVAVTAICLWVTDYLRRTMWPLIAMGQLALTIYVGHLLLLAAEPSLFTEYDVEPAFILVAKFAIGAALFAVIWRQWIPRGPIEGILHLVARAIEVTCEFVRDKVRPRAGE